MKFGVALFVCMSLCCLYSSNAIYNPPGYRPSGPCGTCSRLYTGFQKVLSSVYRIERKMACDKGTVTVVGPDASGDDGLSSAACPEKTVLVSCKCSRGDHFCDGVESSEQTCMARHSSSTGNPIQAIATCVYADPANYLTVRYPQTDFAVMPTATCPAGYKVIECLLSNPWTASSKLVKSVLNPTAQSCTTTESCTIGDGCRVTARCQRI